MSNIITISTATIIYFSPFAALMLVDMHRMWIDRDQHTYGRDFELRMIIWMSFVFAVRCTITKLDSLMKQAERRISIKEREKGGKVEEGER